MKKRKFNKKENTTMHAADVAYYGKHSFLFWLIVPVIMVWMVVGYITGIFLDKPIWFVADKAVGVRNDQVVPYFQEHGTFIENLNQPFVTFWFDDAWLSQYILAYPILKDANFSGTIAVPVNAVETPGYMNWGQLQTIQRDGWEINDHSLEHNCAMGEWNREKVTFEFKNSKHILWKNNLGSDIFVSPCGSDSRVMREEASKMFMGYRTVDPGFNDPKNLDFYNLKVKNIDNKTAVSEIYNWIDESKKNNYWLILVFHKVGEKTESETEDEFNTPLSDFKKIVSHVKEAGIKVITPVQMLASQP